MLKNILFVIIALYSFTTWANQTDQIVSIDIVSIDNSSFVNITNNSNKDIITSIKLNFFLEKVAKTEIVTLDTLLPKQVFSIPFKDKQINYITLFYNIKNVKNSRTITNFNKFLNKPNKSYIPELLNVVFLVLGAFLTHFFTRRRELFKISDDYFKSYINKNEQHVHEFYNYCDASLTVDMIKDKYNDLQKKCLIHPMLNSIIQDSILKLESENSLDEKQKIIKDLKIGIYNFISSPYKNIYKKLRQLTISLR
jgi:hypothetical protein